MRKSIFAKCDMYQLFALCLSAGVRLLSTGPSSAKEAQLQDEKGKSPFQVIHSLSLYPFCTSYTRGMQGQGALLFGAGECPHFGQQSSWRAQAQQLWSPGQSSKPGILQPACPE